MAQEYCPHCHELRNTIETVSSRMELSAKGDVIEIVTTSVDCEACRGFIRSEDGEDDVGARILAALCTH